MPRQIEKRFTIPEAAKTVGAPESTLIADLRAGRVRTSGLEDSLGRRRTTFMTQAQVDRYRATIEKRAEARVAAQRATEALEKRRADGVHFQKIAQQADTLLRRNNLKIQGQIVPVDEPGGRA